MVFLVKITNVPCPPLFFPLRMIYASVQLPHSRHVNSLTFNEAYDFRLIVILEVAKSIQIISAVDFLRCSSSPGQCIKNAGNMVPLFHYPAVFAERIWDQLSNSSRTLLNLLLASLAFGPSLRSILHQKWLLSACVRHDVQTPNQWQSSIKIPSWTGLGKLNATS